MSWTSLIASVLGGVGLFLLGMRLMTDGLRVAAGQALRRVLEHGTATRSRALLSGVLITSLVQSSSAVTVAVIGFANAGLLALEQSVVVIYGSNVGTTVTGWLVAGIGFHFDVKALALPAIGIGMAMRLAGERQRLGALGEALAGFGLFFLGIDVLKGSLEGLQDRVPLGALAVAGPAAVGVFVALGALLTVLMQSSSAAIAIVLTSVGGGVVPIEAGACLVIGANLGTTSTAALAVWGATANAKRVALAHIAFNAVTGLVALLTLPLLLVLIGNFRQVLGLGSEPAAVVAGFHTLFNLLGVALMLPLTARLVALLRQRFRTTAEEESRPRFLDQNVLGTPGLAVRALALELAHIGSITRDMARRALRRESTAPELQRRRESLGRLLDATGEFVTALQAERLPSELGSPVVTALRAGRYYTEATELAQNIARSHERLDPLPADLETRVRALESSVIAFMESTAAPPSPAHSEALARELDEVQALYRDVKDALLGAGAGGRLRVSALAAHLDRLSDLHRLASQLERAARQLSELETPAREDSANGSSALPPAPPDAVAARPGPASPPGAPTSPSPTPDANP